MIVSDRLGRYISGLKAGDFKLYQDRAEQPISVFDAAEEPLNIALLLDTSRSTVDLFDEAAESGAMIYPILFETGFQRRDWNGPPIQFPRGRRGRWGRQNPFPPVQRPQPNDRRRERVEMRNEEAMRFLTKLADVSAGRFYSSKVGDLKTFSLVAEELRHQYRLGFYPDNSKIDGNRHTLRVEVTAPGRNSESAAKLSGGQSH